MTKIISSKIHENDEASSAFAVSVMSQLEWVRMHVSFLKKSRKADEQAPGSIHALRKLCDGEKKLWQISGIMIRQEIDPTFRAF